MSLAADQAALDDQRAQLTADRELRVSERQELQVALAQVTAAQISIELLQRQVDFLGALAASVEQALQARHKPNAGPPRKRTGAPSKSPAGRGQGRPAKARSG